MQGRTESPPTLAQRCLQGLEKYAPKTCRSELIRRGVVVGGDTGAHKRQPLFLHKEQKKEKKKPVQTAEAAPGARRTRAPGPVLSIKEIEECRSVFGEANTVQRSDIARIEDMLVELGVPDACLAHVEGTLTTLAPDGPVVCLDRFVSLVAALKQRYLHTPKPDEELSEAYNALVSEHGSLDYPSLARTAESYNLHLPLESLGSGHVTLQNFSSLLSSDHTRAEEMFVDLGGVPPKNGGPPTGVVSIENIEQATHMFGSSPAAVRDVLKLTRLLSGGELTFEEFRDLVFAPIAGFKRDPASIANVRSQLGLAKSLQQFVDYGVGMVSGSQLNNREEADKLFSLLKWCHWKDNKNVELDTQLASGTLTQALNVILETHANKQQVHRVKPTKPWRRSVAAGMRKLSAQSTEQKDALKRAALAMLLKRSVVTGAGVKEKGAKQDTARQLFLKGIDRAARRADNILSHDGLLNLKEAKHDTPTDRGRRLSKIIHEVTAMGQEPGDTCTTLSASQFDLTTELKEGTTLSDPLTSAVTNMCTASTEVFDETTPATSEACQDEGAEEQLRCSDTESDLNVSMSSDRQSEDPLVSPPSTRSEDVLCSESDKPCKAVKKKAKAQAKARAPTLDSIFEFINKIPKPPSKPAKKLRPAAIVERHLKFKTCRVPQKPKVEASHEVGTMHTDWRGGRGGGGIGILVAHAMSRRGPKEFTL